MRKAPLPFVGGFYKDDTRDWSQQDCVNWLPCVAEVNGTLTPTMLRTPPGLRPYVEAGEGRVRGTYNCEGKLFGVVGKQLYQYVKQVAVPIGQISGNGRVSFAHNQVTNGNQMVIANGSAGYVYDTTTLELGRITDEGFPGAIVWDFLDGYLIFIEPGRRFAAHSELADAYSYNTLDRFTSEGQPDLLVTLAVNAGELFLFSERSYEKFRNTGAVTQPFRTTNQVYNYGCASRYGVAKADGTLLFFGNDGSFYRIQGNSYPVRISTTPIEQAVRDLNWSQAYSYTWKDSGHEVVYWTFPGQLTIGYDIPAQQWHRRESYGMSSWRANSMTYMGNAWYCGDAVLPRLWRMDWDYILEGDQEFVSSLTTPVLSDNNNRLQMPRLELLMATGQEEVQAIPFPAQPTGPEISGAAPDGQIGASYAGFTYTITGGTPPYLVSQRIGSNISETGLSMTSAGVIPVTIPTKSGIFTNIPRVTDKNGLFDELTDYIVISVGPTLALGSTDGSSEAKLIKSETGETWGPVFSPVNGSNITSLYNAKNFRFIGITGDSVGARYSDDYGANWVTSSLSVAAQNFGNASLSGDAILVCGKGAMNRSTNNGMTWFSVAPAETYVTVASTESITVALTDETRPTYSLDSGMTWAAVGNRLDTSLTPALASITCAIGANDRILFGASSVTGAPVIVYTEDGIVFVAVPLPGANTSISALGYGKCLIDGVEKDIVLAGGANGTIYRSTNFGDSWTQVSNLGVGVSAILFNGVLFIVGGDSSGVSAIKTSPDGLAYTTRTQGLSYAIRDIAQSTS